MWLIFLSMCCALTYGLNIDRKLTSDLEMTSDRKMTAERSVPAMQMPELVKYWGYPVEEHWVTTEDGYILGLHRIPHGKVKSATGAAKPVAYLQHALTASSAEWAFGPHDKSLAYILADQGYDVWMGNSRGNSYSRNHTHLDTCSTCKDFWDFGWHEGGLYDVTASIDYVLEFTGQDSVYYTGHSMGCTQYLVMLSMRPEYNEKIKIGALLAPPAYMSHATNFIFTIAQWGDTVDILYHLFGLYEFLPHSDLMSWLAELFCGGDILGSICANFGFLFLGFNPGQLNEEMIALYLDNIPEGTSTRPFVHYAQLFLSAKFQAYDFGATENVYRYNTTVAPLYDLSKVSAKTAIFKGDNDDLVSLIDVQQLVSELPNVVFDHLVELTGWTHIDYAVAMDADIYVYDYIVDLFKQHS